MDRDELATRLAEAYGFSVPAPLVGLVAEAMAWANNTDESLSFTAGVRDRA